jgi:CheY-like chemotaxis protein
MVWDGRNRALRLYDLSKLSVLIVEDNKFMRTTIYQLLYGLGGRKVVQASDAEQARLYLRDTSFDLVLMDWELNKPVSGLDLLKEIRAGSDGNIAMTPVVMLTANSSRANVETARDAGVTEFIAKPISAMSLYEKVCVIIEDPRQYVKASGYFGPDRRRRKDRNYTGPFRRSEDSEISTE